MGLGAPAASAAVAVAGVVVDPESHVRPALLQAALNRRAAVAPAGPARLAIVDFALPSAAPRLFLVDLATGAVSAFLTAHGKGSDPGHSGQALSFSNTEGSHASAVGAYLTGARYYGAHGLSLRLEGLDPTNDAAQRRAIVLHSAPYMDPAFRVRHGKPGRSFGCFVVETAAIEAVVAALEGGIVLYAGFWKRVMRAAASARTRSTAGSRAVPR